MQKKLITSVHVETPEMKIQYYLVAKDGWFGVLIRESNGEEAIRFLAEDETTVYDFILKLAQNVVTPISLNDVADDFQCEVALN